MPDKFYYMRRAFSTVGAKSSFVFLLAIFLNWTAYAQPLQRYQFSHQQMGTQFRIILYAPDSTTAKQASDHAFAKLDSLNQQLSDYLSDSELSLLSSSSGSGQWVKVSPELWEVLTTSQQYAFMSDGAFDITVGPLTKLWRRAIRRLEFPERGKLHLAKAKVNYKYVRLDFATQKVSLEKRGIRLDLGGIAKGYAVDQMMKVIQSYGIESALVDGGGDLLLGTAPPNSTGWKIEKNTIDSANRLTTELIFLEKVAIATSGDRYKFLEWEGKRYSHIVDPRTGLGAQHRRQVTVIAKSCTDADALASTLSILEERQVCELIKKKYSPKDSLFKILILVNKSQTHWEELISPSCE